MSVKYTTIMESKLSETEFARCECCGFTEEYTVEYMENVRNLYVGKFICGLCSEAVKYEILRCGKKQKRIGVDEALKIHTKICSAYVASPSPNVDFISEIGEMFKRKLILNLLSPSSLGTRIISNVDGGEICAAVMIGGSGSCMSALTGGV